jgi:hypothetical protein
MKTDKSKIENEFIEVWDARERAKLAISIARKVSAKTKRPVIFCAQKKKP